ncbi:hypothetical protein PVT68_09305 [Microbulbifer bruguierae]|uniref:DUF11 domain-containing protein n=1 Tax=Microbulbifer bruguierae TaxID=3029061 RepID=A0ABY8NI33_9GAMM|nr:hypothetical protein [Microbulbifer bruguierae]WGL18478.1 hypothetical protein PVT68_09305 [Microbulbifer bruguierae]
MSLRAWLLGSAALLLSMEALAVGTEAGTTISNTASATYTDEAGNPQSVNSNTTSLRVDELLDVTVVSNDAGYISVSSPESNAVLSFTVTNTGNGKEAFDLTLNNALGGDQFDPENSLIYIDSNGDGLYDAADALFTAGSPLELDADGSVTVFVVSDIPDALSSGDQGLVDLTAESVTAQATSGSDTPGSVFAGQGDGGGNAVVGNSGGAASSQNGYQVSLVQASFTKSQSVADPFGGSSAVQGSIITYTLTFSVSGSGEITNVILSDNVPDNTSYVAGSITLNGAGKSDVADSDEVRFDSSATPPRIEINIGTVTAPATHTVTFQVEID